MSQTKPEMVKEEPSPTDHYALFNSRRSLSAIIAINSEFVGLPFAAEIV